MSDIKTKFINDPENIAAELLEGYVLAYPNQVKLAAENIVVRANPKGNDKVAIVTLGGSGHEPALSGFVGEGMLDCSVVGDVFAAPGAQRLFQALQLMDREAGILLVVLNHSGDVMSANMACQLAARKGIKVKKLLTHDDISAGIGANVDDRRGLAGCVPLYKILGAAAEEGKSLDELIEIGERYNKNVATLAVAMRSCTHPQNGGTITNLPDGIMEIGMGQHGEGGGGQKPLVSADDTAAEMVDLLCQQLQPKAGDKMLLIINGVGATTHMELNIIFRKAYKELEARGLQVVASRIQEILTVQEQAGFQMIMAILDEDHIDYLNNKRADAPYWTTLGKLIIYMKQLTIEAFKAMLDNALKQIKAREEEFSKLDAVIGDGDHGTAIVAAMTAVNKSAQSGTEFKQMLGDMGMDVMMEVSGSTSTLLGAFFLGMSDHAEGTELDAAGVKVMFAGGLANVQQQTQAKRGDKTMMDALIPAVEAMQACTSDDIKEVLNAGAKAALDGAEATVPMKANFGRARNYGERSIGFADSGATSWSCMFASFAEVL